MLMHRQAPLAIGALAACAVVASGSVLLREQILTFSAWPNAHDGGRGPEIAIPHGLPLAPNGGARGPEAGGGADASSRTVERSAADRALLRALGLSPDGGTLTLGPSAGVAPVAGNGVGRTRSGDGGRDRPTVTTTGPSGSGTPTPSSGTAPLSGYGPANGPVTGDAAPTSGSGARPKATGPSIFTPTTPSATAAPQAADTAPQADVIPMNSAADNAPPPADPDEPSDQAPAPTPAPPAEDTPPPTPAEETPPSDPTPPVEETPAPTEETPTPPPADPAPSDPAPPADPAPADPAPPADTTPTPDPAPASTPDDGAQTVGSAGIPASAQ